MKFEPENHKSNTPDITSAAVALSQKESRATNLKALFSAILQGTVFVFWAYFLTFLPKPLFIFYWALAAVLLLGAYLLWKGELRISLSRKQVPYLLLFAVLESSAFALLTFGVVKVGAALTSFIMPSGTVFTIVIASLVFKEKLSRKEIFGIVIVLAGLFILNWLSGLVVTTASLIILAASLALAISNNTAKHLLKSMSSGSVNWVRLVSILLFGTIYLFWTSTSFEALSLANLSILFAGIILGPILVFVLFYDSAQNGRLSKAIILKDTSPLFTLIFAYAFLGERVSLMQLLGGLIILAGVFIILHRKKNNMPEMPRESQSGYAAIFDIDGVIVDSVRMNWSAIIEVLDKDYGIKFPEKDIKKYVGRTLNEQIVALNKRYGLEINLREFEPRLKAARKIAIASLPAKQGVIDLLEKLHQEGIPLAVATSNPRELMEKKLRASKTHRYFQVYVTKDDVERHKPNPDVYLEAAKQLGVAPERCVVFEDAPYGVEAAKRAGMKVCAVMSDYANEKDLQRADLLVESLEKVELRMLRELFSR